MLLKKIIFTLFIFIFACKAYSQQLNSYRKLRKLNFDSVEVYSLNYDSLSIVTLIINEQNELIKDLRFQKRISKKEFQRLIKILSQKSNKNEMPESLGCFIPKLSFIIKDKVSIIAFIELSIECEKYYIEILEGNQKVKLLIDFESHVKKELQETIINYKIKYY